jgi:hypothetical protein
MLGRKPELVPNEDLGARSACMSKGSSIGRDNVKRLQE